MSKPLRIVAGIVGLVVIVLGIRQMMSGNDEMSGKTEKKPQEAGERVSVPAHNCSLRVPKGWEQKDAAEGGVMFSAPKSSGYVANFSILSQPFADSLRGYADANVSEVKTAAPAAKFTSDTPFATESGAPAFKVTFSNKFEKLDLDQTMYFFDGPPGRKIVITSTCQTADGAALEPLFDACVKSLTVSVK